MNPLDELLTKIANTELTLWQNWKDNDEHPDHFQPLLKKFQPTINAQVKRFTNNPNVPATRVAFEADKMFLKACQTFDPNQSQIKTHVINHLKKLSRFVGDNSNTGKMIEPRRHLINDYKQVKNNLLEDLDRVPTSDDILHHMNLLRADKEMAPLKINELKRLESELSKKDLTESLSLNDSKLYESPKEQQAIMMLHYSNPINAGDRHQYRLTPDEHNVFKRIYPLSDDGVLELNKTMKLKDIATELHFSAPKVSRTIKTLNKKVKAATQLLVD